MLEYPAPISDIAVISIDMLYADYHAAQASGIAAKRFLFLQFASARCIRAYPLSVDEHLH
jgi:hypothetical protein